MFRKLSNDPLVRHAQLYGGSLETRMSRFGVAYVYRYTLNGKKGHKSFDAGTSAQVVKAFMTNIQSAKFIQKHGTLQGHKIKAIPLRFSQLWDWYSRNKLKKASKAKEYRMRYTAKKFQSYLQHHNLQGKNIEKYEPMLFFAFREWLVRKERFSIASSSVVLINLRALFQEAFAENIIGNFPFPK